MFDTEGLQHDKCLEVQIAGSKAESYIIESIQQKTLPRVSKDGCFETKFSVLDTLSKIAEAITRTEDNELTSRIRTDGVPDAITDAMIDIGDILSEEEIERVVAEKHVLARAEAATTFRESPRSTNFPFQRLFCFTGIFIGGSVVLDFSLCIKDIEECLAREPLDVLARQPRRLMPGDLHPGFTTPDYVIPTCIQYHISAKLNRQSSWETQLNALKALMNIGQQILKARGGGPTC
jgi:hypothetical protein